MGNGMTPAHKEWIATAIGAAAGLASSIIGGVSASAAARESARIQRRREAEEEAWHTRRYNENYLDTAAGQNLVRRAKAMYDRSIKRAEGARAVAGGTDASVAQAKESANNAMGETMANIAANDTARKDRVDEMHQKNLDKFAQQDMAREQGRAQAITSAAQQASNALISAGAAIESANAPKSITGTSNNGTEVPKVVDTPTTKPYVEVNPLTGQPLTV